MSGLGAGLARGLAMYGQGRMVAEEREALRQEREAERKRQAERDALLMEQTRLSMANTRAEMDRRKAQDGIAAEGRTNEAIGKGFRPVGDQWDTFNDLVGIDPSKAETITVNGQTMRKVAPTQAFQQQMRTQRDADTALQQQTAESTRLLESIRAQLPAGIRPMAVDLPTAKSLLGKFAEQRMAPAKAGPAPITQKDDNGNLWFSTDGGRSWNPSRINTGASTPPTEAPRAPAGPANPAAAISQAPGSGFSSQFQLPAPLPSRQASAPAAGGMPTFGNKNKPRALPNAVVEDLRQNEKTLSVIEQAIADLERNPDATGLKGYVPDYILNQANVRGYSDGVSARANVADIGSMTVKDRSGASVTAAEAPRLKPFIPATTKDAKTNIQNLRRMAEIIRQDNEQIRSFYGDPYGRGGNEPDLNDPGFQAFLAAQLQGRRP